MKLLAFLLLFTVSLKGQILHTYLTWSGGCDQAITFNIHSTSLSPITVEVFTKEGTLVKTVTSKGTPFLEDLSPRFLHFVDFADLEEETLYTATIQDEMDHKEVKFRTLPTSSTKLKLVVGGDWEKTEGGELMARLIAKQTPHALLLGGDYPRWVVSLKDFKDWDDWLNMIEKHLITEEGCQIPLILAIGNHDVFGEYGQPYENAPFFNAYFKQSAEKKNYFIKTIGKDIALFVLDSGHTSPHSGEQKTWLEETLKLQQERKIKMALYHVPLYPSVRFKQKKGLFLAVYNLFKSTKYGWMLDKIYSPETSEGLKHWAPLFDTYHLTSAFEHHEHCFKRTKLLRKGKVDPKGTLYLGDGGINPFYYVTPIQGYRRHFAKTVGNLKFFWVVTFEENYIHYSAIGAHGKKIDAFTQRI